MKVVPITPVDNAHTMCMHGKVGFQLLVEKLILQVSALSPLPMAYRSALADPN
jgi:hypothetical protein